MLARIVLACILLTSTPFAQSSGFDGDEAVQYAQQIVARGKRYTPASGYVPDSATAVAIATDVLIPIYGKTKIEAEKPWHTGLKDGVWTVVGTFNGKGEGGEAIIQIDKMTGAIIFVTHTM